MGYAVPGVYCLPRDNPNHLRPSTCKRCRDKYTCQPLKAIRYRPRVNPVFPPMPPSIWPSSSHNHPRHNNKPQDTHHLERAYKKLHLTKDPHGKAMNRQINHNKHRNPYCDGDILGPVSHENIRRGCLCGEYRDPAHPVLPAHCEPEPRVDEAGSVAGKGA